MIRQSLFSLVLLTAFNVSYASGSGVGSAVLNCSDLAGIANDMTGSYYLSQDLDCNGAQINPISDGTDAGFSGTIDGGIYEEDSMGALKYTGKNYSISNFTLLNNDDEIDKDVGLFRALSAQNGSNPLIKNLDFSNVTVRGRDKTVRGLIAATADSALISNITISNLTIEARPDIDKPLDDTGVTGGVVGVATKTTLFNVHVVDALINKNGYGGGLIGRTSADTSINKSSVKLSNTTGNKCDLSDQSLCGFGGLIGHVAGDYNTVNISESSATGKITVYKRGGGLVGVVEPKAILNISNSYATVDLVPDCYWHGGLDNTCIYMGGLIGRAKEENATTDKKITLSNVYAAGRVKPEGDENGRAIIGEKDAHGSTRVTGSNSYFDKNAVEKKNSGDKISIAKTTDEMQDADNAAFVTWDRNIWKFEDGKYPALYYNNPPAN